MKYVVKAIASERSPISASCTRWLSSFLSPLQKLNPDERSISLVLSLLAILSPFVLPNAATAQPTAKPTATPPVIPSKIEPQALALLKAASDRLASARSMSFTAIATYESPSLIGPPLAYTTRSQVTLQRPDRLQVLTLGDGPASEFYYDGKAIAAYAPAENLVAIAPAPATLDAALQMAYQSADIYFPFTDLIVSDPYKDMAEGLTVAFVVGQSKVVGGTKTDIVAIANDKVFAQIWIGTEDKLPRAIRVVYRDDPSRLRHQVEFLNWQLNPAIASDAFSPAHLKKASPIPFARPEPPAALRPAPTNKPPTPQPKSGDLK